MSDRQNQFARDVTAVGDIIGTVPIEDDEDNPYDHARRVLRSQWLADHDREVAARTRADVLREAIDAVSENSLEDDTNDPEDIGYMSALGDALDSLRSLTVRVADQNGGE